MKTIATHQVKDLLRGAVEADVLRPPSDLDSWFKESLWHFFLVLRGRSGLLLVDLEGRGRRLGWLRLLLCALPLLFLEAVLALPALFATLLLALWTVRRRPRRKLNSADPVVGYMRTDLACGVRAGGSVGHIRGVAAALEGLGWEVLFLTTDRMEAMRGFETRLVRPLPFLRVLPILPSIAANLNAFRMARFLRRRGTGLIYQRHSLNNFAGALVSRRLGLPFVLEYNGSEVWISRHWGRREPLERLSLWLEGIALRAADVVVAVSKAMGDELAARGVPRERILVNPNGVDPAIYDPERWTEDRTRIRRSLGIDGATVVGFLGTFGPWHGAEVLAQAAVKLARPDLRFLFIGDGARRRAAEEILRRSAAEPLCRFTGEVAQAEGPAYLAACDILVAPHVPNADGTPFFGSPTKLFEYMSVGRAIAASRLDQIGDVVEDGRTALLVEPGSADSLARAIETLAGDGELRRRLGGAARATAIERHTWRRHAEKILNAIRG